jgi:hypothetical protein
MLLRSTALAFVLAASVVPLAACSGSQSVGEPTTTANTQTTVAPITAVVTGRNKVFANALSQVALRADQRATIEQMALDAETRAAPEHQAHQALALAIADQVQAGAIDRTALQPKIDAVSAAHVAARPADRAAFEKLHDLLTPDQRVAFVTAMQSNFGSWGGAGQGQGAAQGPRQGQMRGRMQKWAADLGLSQDQQDQIRQQLQARWQTHFATAVTGTDEQKTDAIQDGQMAFQGHAMHQQMKNTLEAFKGDTFSMDQVAPIQNEKPMAHQFAGHMLGMLESALPILTPAQRTIAATKLRARAANLEAEDEATEAPQTQTQ